MSDKPENPLAMTDKHPCPKLVSAEDSSHDEISFMPDDVDGEGPIQEQTDIPSLVMSTETRQLRCMRTFLMGVLLVGGAACTGTYFFVSNEAKKISVSSNTSQLP